MNSCLKSASELFLTNANTLSVLHLAVLLHCVRLRFVRGVYPEQRYNVLHVGSVDRNVEAVLPAASGRVW